MNYSINLSSFNIIKKINKNIKILNIDIITFITLNKNKLILHDILYILELFYSLLSLNQLIIIDNIILFNDLYYIIENNIEFYIKFKFKSFFDIINILFHFYINFSIIELNLVNFESIKLDFISLKSIRLKFIDLKFTKLNSVTEKSI